MTLDPNLAAAWTGIALGMAGGAARGLFFHREGWLGGYGSWRRRLLRIQAGGIRVNACFVVGLDGHTPAVFEAIHDFAREVCPFDIQVTYPTPFPGTPMYRRWKREGRLTHDGDWSRCTLFDINFMPKPMSAEELRAGFHDLVSRLYNEDFTAWRREEARKHRKHRHRETVGAA